MRLNSNAGWVTFGTGLQVVVQLSTLVVLARLLSPAELGLTVAATLVIQLVFIASEYGFGVLIVQKQVLQREFVATAYVLSCLFGLCFGCLVAVTAPLISRLFATSELTAIVRLYSLYLIIAAPTTVFAAFLQRELRFRRLVITDITSFVLGYAGVSVTLALLGASYWSVIFGYLAQITIKLCLLDKRIESRRLTDFSLPHAQELLNFGMGQSLSRFGSYLAGQIDSLLVTYFLGMAAIGIYSRAHQLATIPANQLGIIFDKLIFPYLSRNQDKQAAIAQGFCRNLRLALMMGSLASTGIWLLGEHLVAWVLGGAWQAVALPLKVLALAIPFRLVQHICDPTARAFGSTYRRAWRQWLYAALTGVACWLIWPRGLAAVSMAVVLAALVNACLMIDLCRKILGLSPARLLAALAPTLLLASVLSAAVLLFSQLSPLQSQLSALLAVGSVLTSLALVLGSVRLRSNAPSL